MKPPVTAMQSWQGNGSQLARDAEEKKLGDEVVDTHPPAATPYSKSRTTQKRWIIFIAAWAGWFSTASSFIYFPAIPFMAQDMDISIQDVNLTVTSYTIASATFPVFTGNAADRFGRRLALIASLAVYSAANIGIAVQRSFAALFVLRMLQSAAISGMDTLHPIT